MKALSFVKAGALAVAMVSSGLAPIANAQHLTHKIHHRQKTESQWRNGTYAGAALGALGLLTHKDTLTAVGAGVAGYSGYRWSKDTSSRHRLERARAWRRHHHAKRHR